MYLPKVNLLFSMRRYAEAEDDLRAALAERPDDAVAHAMLGVALSRQNKYLEALEESQAAIGLDPTSSYVFFARSLVLIRAWRTAGALDAIREAIALDSTSDPDYFMILAALLFDKQQWNESLEAVDRGLAIDPRHVECLNRRGQVLLRLGRVKEAEQAFASALEAAPEHAEAHHAQGVLLLNRAEGAAALEYLLEARRLDPLTKNDSDAIALAAGRAMRPFCWLGRIVPRWYLWPVKVRWAYLMAIYFAYIGLFIYFPFSNYRRLWVALPGQIVVMVFGAVMLNLLLAPLTLDVLAMVSVRLFRPKLVEMTRYTKVSQIILLVTYGFMHLLATLLGGIPSFVISILAVAACIQFVGYYHRARMGPKTLSAVYVLYGIPLAFVCLKTAEVMSTRPRNCLSWAGLFAILSFFSDNVLRWVERHET